MNTLQARDFYTELGIDAIPLRPDSNKGDDAGKHALCKAWQKRDPRRMWMTAPQDSNVGLRGGGNIGAAFLDCDDKNKAGTFENVTRYLDSIGVTEYPLIQTASQVGRHIYLTVTDAPQGNACKLDKETGEGEFRFGAGAYIVAAPSVVDGCLYSLLSGDFAKMPKVSFADLRPILGETVNDWTPSPTVPRNAFAILNGNAEAIAKFASRSEAEESLLLSLANAGFSFAEVEQLFNNNPCAGKYAEMKKNARGWLLTSFAKAEAKARKDSKERETILRAIAWANERAWTGRGGEYEQAVFLANMTIAYKAGTVTGWAASQRKLAELAGVTGRGALKIQQRLLLAGWLKLERRFTVDCANKFSLSTAVPADSQFCTAYPLPEVLKTCEEVGTLCKDAFRTSKRRDGQKERMASGQIGRQLWDALRSEPMTAEDLAVFTGRDPRTVTKYLDRMAKLTNQMTGEVLPMVELTATAEGEKWHALDVDLHAVAVAVGTAGKGSAQRLQHAKERRRHARDLMSGAAV